MEAMCVVYTDVILAFANVEADVEEIFLLSHFSEFIRYKSVTGN